jgi:hypothetical protein
MKIKHLIIVSLILAVLTIGAVSASDDISEDIVSADASVDELAVDDTADDAVVEATDDAEVVGQHYDTVDADLDVWEEFDTNDGQLAGVHGDDPLNGTVSLSIDGTQYYNQVFKDSDDDYGVGIGANDMNLPDNLKTGTHSVMLSYLKNGVKESVTKNVKFIYSPDVEAADISTGDVAVIAIEQLPGASGTATLYNVKEGVVGSAVQTVAISNGFAKILVNGLAKGSHEFKLNMTINGENYERNVYIDVKDNTAGYAATASSNINVGDNAVITFSGPKTKGDVHIYVDGQEIKTVKYVGGTLSENIVGLSEGTHQITVQYMKGEDFYSKTFDVVVAKKAATKQTIKLTLKKVTVKKSAKKLVLQATLKINNKVVKGKKLTFKFNGKKYTAKTNKKGVAKVTIKKKVLKKLKVGKKVKYQVSYSGKTVKKTAKVKK